MEPNGPHPWPLPNPPSQVPRSRSDSRHPNAQRALMNTPTHRGSIRRELPAGPPASRPSQVPRHSNMTAVSDLLAVPMSPPIRLPTTALPSLPSSAQAPPPTSAQAPPPLSAQAPDSLMIDDNRSQPSHAIVPIPTNFALAQVHANTSAMGESERRSMQSQMRCEINFLGPRMKRKESSTKKR